MLPPTLLTTMSRRPSSARAASTSVAAVARSDRSAGTTTARRPAAAMRLATSSSWASVRAEMTTSAPASASATAVAAPMPRPAPVTTATRSVSRNRSRIMSLSPPALAPADPRPGRQDSRPSDTTGSPHGSGRSSDQIRVENPGGGRRSGEGVLADPGVHGDAGGDARIDGARRAEHGDRAHLGARGPGVLGQARALLAEHQHAAPGEHDGLERDRAGQVVDADERQVDARGPAEQPLDGRVGLDVLVALGHHRPPPVPAAVAARVHPGGAARGGG